MTGPRHIGVCYYPEHWPESGWAEDARRMAETGLTRVRIGEFAWSRLEPDPGRFDFGWLDRAIETLAAAGLGIVLGTPTATPPRWMLDRHPDMLAVDRDGRPRGFGSRRHYCFSHEGYRAEGARITRALAERYGRHPAVVAWQTDNEYGCHDTAVSYSHAARKGFRRWLASRYGSVADLNAAWGTVFWSMEYRSFEDIELPHATVTEANPAHWLAFRRYSSDQVAAFNRAQVDMLREHAPGVPILHNYMGGETGFDHFDLGADLDGASWDVYPLGYLEVGLPGGRVETRDFMRQGDPDFQAFNHDLYRAVGRGRWWIMELQPGPVNWAPYNPVPLPGMSRAWALEAFAHGAETVCWFRWRQAPFAQEQMHAGLLRPDGQPAPALAEARRVADDLATLAAAAPEVGASRADVALLFDYPSIWATEIQPQSRSFDTIQLLLDAYRALRRRGLSVDILGPTAESLSGYRAVLAPGLIVWTEVWRNLIATADGPVLLGPRTGAKTPELSIPAGLPPDCPALIDLTVARVESLRPDAGVPLAGGGTIRHWREFVEPGAGVVTVLACEDGTPALLTAGAVSYLAGWPDAVAFDRMLDAVLPIRPGDLADLPDGVRTRRMGGLQMLINYGSSPVDLTGRLADRDWVLGGPRLAPADVAAFRR